MKVKATFRHVFNVARVVEVDEDDFVRWAQDRYGEGYDVELAIAAWIDNQDDELLSEVFKDWRTHMPLPDDFEFQYSEVEDVELESAETETGR